MSGRSIADLEAAFNARRCMICGAQADVVCVGSDGVYRNVLSGPPGHLRRVLRCISEPVAEVNLCMMHAAAAWLRQQATRK